MDSEKDRLLNLCSALPHAQSCEMRDGRSFENTASDEANNDCFFCDSSWKMMLFNVSSSHCGNEFSIIILD